MQGVVAMARRFDLISGILDVEEPMLVHVFWAEPAFEGLTAGIICRIPGYWEIKFDPVPISPLIEEAPGELRVVITPDGPGGCRAV